MGIFRKKAPCVPSDVEQRLLREVYEEAMAHLNEIEADQGKYYTWRIIEDITELRVHVSLEVSQRLHRGDLKAKIEKSGYRLCVEAS